MLLLASRGCCNMSPFQQQQKQKCLSSAIFVLSAFRARCCWDSGTQIRKVVIFKFFIDNSIFFPNHLFSSRTQTRLCWTFRVLSRMWNCADPPETQRPTCWLDLGQLDPGRWQRPKHKYLFLFGWGKKKQIEFSIYSLYVTTNWWTLFLGQPSVGHRGGTR